MKFPKPMVVQHVLFATLCTLSLASIATAVEWNVSVGAGASIPSSNNTLQEGTGTGFTGTVAVAFGLGHGFEAAGRFAYSRFPRDDAGVERKSGIVEQPRRILEMSGGVLTQGVGSLDLRFGPSQKDSHGSIRPFVLGSIGLASFDLEPAAMTYAYAGHTWTTTIAGERGTHLALGIGAGLRFDLNRRFRILCEGRFETVFRNEASLRNIPLRLEMGLGG